jgi:UDP-N-acetylmuramoyl-tripeptide--D-alanyl-D-alanine ligase
MPIQNGNKKILVLGDMRDLGPSSDTLHTETGGLITGETADVLITVGEHAYHAGKSAAAGSNPPGRIIHCSTVTEAGEALFSVAEPGDILYVKGSRSVGLERILEER